MAKKIFFSWSNNISLTIANAFYEFMPQIIPVSQKNIFFSPNTILKDATWFKEIQLGLTNAETGIVFLTKENIKEEWILFEAGGLFSKGSLCVLLCDLDVPYLKEQDSFFENLNVTRLNDKEDLFKLFDTIAIAISPDTESKITRKHFDTYFHELKEKLDRYIEKDKGGIIGDFNDFADYWHLKYQKGKEKGGETLKIDRNGKYFLKHSLKETYYFQLKLLEKTDSKIVWQKFQIEDGHKISNYIHSIETLNFSSDKKNLTGTDTFGYEITYQRF